MLHVYFGRRINMNRRTLHFVGFRTNEEYLSAVKVFGKPDFIHLFHDRRMYGDTGFPIDPNTELVLFGSKGRNNPSEYCDQDHERH
jgi:hypothetical protein